MIKSRTLVASLILPVSALAQTPASDINVNTNTSDTSGLFVETVSEMEKPAPQAAIGASTDLSEPEASSVLPMPAATTPQPATTPAPVNTAAPAIDPSAQTTAPSQAPSTSVTSLQSAEKEIVSLKKENEELQERLNNLNKQMLLLRQSFQQANSALLQRINELQGVQGQKPAAVQNPGIVVGQTPIAPATTANPAATTVTTTTPAADVTAPAAATTVTTTTPATDVTVPAAATTVTTTTPAADVTAPAASTTVTTTTPAVDVTAPAASTTVTTTTPVANATAPAATTTTTTTTAPATEEEPLLSIVPEAPTTEPQTETNITTPAAPIAPVAPQTQPSVQGNQPSEGRSMGSPAWEESMKQEEETKRKLEEQTRQQAQKAAPSELSIAPPTAAETTNAAPTKSASRLETLTQNTELEGGIKNKVLGLLNDPGFILKLGIGLAVLGMLWLISTLIPRSKRSKKEAFEEDLYENEESEDEENMPSFETDSSDWGKSDLELEHEPSEEKEFGSTEFPHDEAEEEVEDTQKNEYQVEEPEYTYDRVAEEETTEDKETESFSIADEELDEEDMVESKEEPHAVDASTQEYDFSEQVEDSDNVSIKLDLARAYLEMRDFDTAEEVLNTVVDQGTPSQQQEARNLMDELRTAKSE